ncbi:MAG: 3'(2'),5'-bisphosphate nucleotidase CysQ [Bacteroides sp.]|nr:3'(2'),5'-bisphosphate nucleotidase CysQ [Bacteroides sp.]
MQHDFLLDAIRAALLAGDKILSIYDDPLSDFQVEKKADNSPLTIADRKANEAITDILRNTPYPILSEEGKMMPYEERSSWETLWVVDPLDGTKEFIKRNGEFTVNIALVHHSVPVMGVIYLPVKRELYFAAEGLGAYKLEQVTASEVVALDDLLAQARRLPLSESHEGVVVVASRSHLSAETEAYIRMLQEKHGEVKLVSSGSSIKICLVAEGAADVYPRFAPTMEWDTAAGHAIARAAGREIYKTDKEEPLTYNKADLLNPWFIVKPVASKL